MRAPSNLKEVLFIDHAVFVRATAGGPGTIKVDSFLYDLRTRRRLTRVTKTVPTARAEKELQTLASSLYLNVSYEVELVESKDAPPPKQYRAAAILQDLVVLDGGGRGGDRRGAGGDVGAGRRTAGRRTSASAWSTKSAPIREHFVFANRR